MRSRSTARRPGRFRVLRRVDHVGLLAEVVLREIGDTEGHVGPRRVRARVATPTNSTERSSPTYRVVAAGGAPSGDRCRSRGPARALFGDLPCGLLQHVRVDPHVAQEVHRVFAGRCARSSQPCSVSSKRDLAGAKHDAGGAFEEDSTLPASGGRLDLGGLVLEVAGQPDLGLEVLLRHDVRADPIIEGADRADVDESRPRRGARRIPSGSGSSGCVRRVDRREGVLHPRDRAELVAFLRLVEEEAPG